MLNFIKEAKPIASHSTCEQNRGRTENRKVQIYFVPDQIDPGWKNLKRIIHLKRFGYRPDKGEYDENHFYILSRPINNAQVIGQAIRNHWAIENSLHYVKDVRFNEDKNKITQENPATILSIFQDIAINLYRCKGYRSIKKATIHHANKIKELLRYITAHHISEL